MASSYPLVKFVSAPDPSATVRLDLNDSSAGARRRVEADIDLGAPSIDGEPDAVGQAFGFRYPKFTVQITGSKSDALAFVSALSKEILRRTNWVMFQLNASTAPVWFKTYRGGYSSLSLERVFNNTTTGGSAPAGFLDVWRVEVPLVAEAFAYGARVVHTSATLGSSLGATNPMRLALPAIKGDAPTCLRYNLVATTGNVRAVKAALVAADAPVNDTVVDIGSGDGFSAGSGTASGVANAAALGGSWRVVTIGTGTNLLTRLSGATAPAASRYKVLLHCEADPVNTTTPNRYSFAFGISSGALTAIQYGTTAVVDTPAYDGATNADSYRGWVDLGEFTFPRGIDIPPDLTLTQPASNWDLKIGTPAGVAGTVRVDALKLIPVSGPTIRSTTYLRTAPASNIYFLLSSASNAANWDADDSAFWITDVSTGAISAAPVAIAHQGAFLVADPGATQNLLVVLLDGTASGATGVWTMVVSYQPRYLYLGDGIGT